MTEISAKKYDIFWLLVLLLLVGAALRWAQLHAVAGLLNSDEAANGLDALSLIQNPRLTPFFPTFTGRESGWHYWLVPFVLAFGLRPLAIRLAATMIGCLTLAAIYALGRRWLTHPDLAEQMELAVNEAAAFAQAATEPDVPLYVTHVTRQNPTLLFWAAALAPRPVDAFDATECWVQTAVPTLYLLNNTTQPPRETYETVNRDATTQLILAAPDGRRYNASTTASFGGPIHLTLAAPLSRQVQPGDTLHLSLAFQADQPSTEPYSLFLHLYGVPSPYEGGPIWAQTDSTVCLSHPMTAWRPLETVTQSFSITLPGDLPPGDYTLITGLYQPATGLRLPLTGPVQNEWNHFALAEVEVRQSGE